MSFNKKSVITEGFVKGNEKVISDFYAKNLPIISNYILLNSGNTADAEDVFHDALVVTYQKLKTDSLKLNCSLSTFVYSVSQNIWMNKLRKRNKILPQNEALEISEDTNQSIIENINDNDKQLLFQKHFMKLGSTCQNIMIHFFNGKSMSEISKIMSYSEGYSRKKKFECKKRLLEMIETDPLYMELHTDANKGKL